MERMKKEALEFKITLLVDAGSGQLNPDFSGFKWNLLPLQ